MENSVLTVHKTENYGMFRVLKGNRTVEPKRIEKIKASMQIKYIPIPIIVNEKMQVIDGQGRLIVLEDLGLPVYYTIVPGLDVNDCALLNIASTLWTSRDVINMYANTGNENYQRLAAIMDEFGTNSSENILFAIRRDNKAAKRPINGVLKKENQHDFIFTEYEYQSARRILCMATELYGIIKENAYSKLGHAQVHFKACIACARAEGYNHGAMVKAFKENAHRYSGKVTYYEAIKMYANWYNRYRKKDFMDAVQRTGGFLKGLEITYNATENRFKNL